MILFIAIFVFGFLMYATSDLVGSPTKFYDLLLDASEKMPIPTNVDGSYLSFYSVDGLVFAIDLFAAGFSTVWLDQAYWQRAIASRPETSVRAYILGGIAWYVSASPNKHSGCKQLYSLPDALGRLPAAGTQTSGCLLTAFSTRYGIPFGFATAMGLGCAALTSNPR